VVLKDEAILGSSTPVIYCPWLPLKEASASAEQTDIMQMIELRNSCERPKPGLKRPKT
jgi:hypothetical protein